MKDRRENKGRGNSINNNSASTNNTEANFNYSREALLPGQNQIAFGDYPEFMFGENDNYLWRKKVSNHRRRNDKGKFKLLLFKC